MHHQHLLPCIAEVLDEGIVKLVNFEGKKTQACTSVAHENMFCMW